MKQFLLDQFFCDECNFEFYVPEQHSPEHCPKCTGMLLSDAQTVKAEQWRGEQLL
ncbi:hypothetical protein [Paenibacillus oleatilyticus]|uniref:hypothetical protein n=1 Tax=Paenibacillus oleatilyticus TaxID=2594886 RepID=UPI001C1FC607|nr:hypothetical protein [Paenibacillus oleatilyticus]MBU7315983.1 hypothetical protein [Paenibacillus oleatilyticus]